MSLPLKNVLVVDFSQFLAGPFATLRLQDLGATVIKVENPRGGDLCRRLYLTDTLLDDGDSTLFHAINRGKQSIALDLKSPQGKADARTLAQQAHVVIQNFRPGVIDRLGLDYDSVKAFNPAVVYGSVSGYGDDGPWRGLPGQDLLAQARSGIMWLSGNRDAGPVPVGIPLGDILAGATLAHGVLAGLYQQATTGTGSHVQTSLLECLVDAQFELLTTYLNNGQKKPARAAHGSAHVYLGAPYGVYDTQDGQLALAMTPIDTLSDQLNLPALRAFAPPAGSTFAHRDEITSLVADRLKTDTARAWEARLAPKGVWCARILEWDELLGSGTFKALKMVSRLTGANGPETFLRAPLRLDGSRPSVASHGPRLNAHEPAIRQKFLADAQDPAASAPEQPDVLKTGDLK